MNTKIIVIGIVIVLLLILYGVDFIKNKLTTKQMVTIAMMAAISFILGSIKIYKFPQGGSITLFATVPILLVAVLYGRTAGITCGLVSALLCLIGDEIYIVHPVQFFLDYIIGTMALGLAGTFGSNTKTKLFCGALFAGFLNFFSHFLAGVVFYWQYAEGMNVYLYSIWVNFLGSGFEGVIACFVLALLPVERIRKQFVTKGTLESKSIEKGA